MELPPALRAAVEQALEGVPLVELQKAAAILSDRYRAETRDHRLHLDGDLAVGAYLAARLPATYAAVRSSLTAAAKAVPGFDPTSLLDIGAGPGTALWAASDCWPSIRQARLIEASDHVLTVGKTISSALPGVSTDWMAANMRDGLPVAPPADLVTLAYVLDELPPPAIGPLVERLWALASQMLVLVEPGTPAGWRRILEARRLLLDAGAHIVAPCPHGAPCPLSPPDWCHFVRRLPRSRLHRLTKGGDAPFEDEKFIYLAASRHPAFESFSRVLAPPREGKGRVSLKLCKPDGAVAEALFTKRDGPAFKAARRASWGDALAPDPA